MKRFLPLFFSLCLLTSCERSKGFSLKKIESSYPPSTEWQAYSQPTEEIYSLLAQPYTYLGSGNHTYAFVSADDTTVIKFFKQKHMNTRTWKKLFYSKEKLKQRAEERKKTLNSYKIAFKELPEETGILYLHLSKAKDLGITLTLIDQHGKLHLVDLDDMEFLLQKKGTLAFEHLKKLLHEDSKETVLEAVSSLLGVIKKRNELGIYDKDLQFFKNFGFVGNRAIEIDIGEFSRDKELNDPVEELNMLAFQIQDFFKQEAPDLLLDIDHLIRNEFKQ